MFRRSLSSLALSLTLFLLVFLESVPAWAALQTATSIATPMAPVPSVCTDEWPAWRLFRSQFIAPDGRITDPETPRAHTVSEAQAYGLFFALVGNDRPSFERILKWTENNLASGDLTAHLPAWQWGKRDDGNWGVVDANSASDADLWIVYALGEAGRLWKEPRFTALSSLIAARMLRESTANLPGLGLTLLPGPQGFKVDGERWRLNPSYVPLHLLRWLSKHDPNPAWGKIAASSRNLIVGSAPKGFSPDWIVYRAKFGFEIDAQGSERGEGAYNAIRVYLWAGLLSPNDPASRALLDALAPMAKFVAKNGYPPESLNIMSGEGAKPAPSGFSAALLPFLQARGDKAALQTQVSRLQAKPIRPQAYYEQALGLFGLGAYEGFYKFAGDGSLVPKWRVACTRKT